jgi:signal transduction histidine kinase/ActR/RegA family two-component response regulator
MDDSLDRLASALMRSGDDFFPAAVAEISAALGADLVFIGERIDDEQVRTVAVMKHGLAIEPFTFPLAGSATELLATQPACVCQARACDRFPGDAQITALAAQAVVAVRVTDAKEAFIGVIVAVLVRPLAHADGSTALLQMLAARVGAELQRARSERELAESEAHLRQIQQVDTIGQLAGGIAHDFNNLLMLMIGYAETLRERHGPSREMLELIAAANRATTLTRQLLAYGRRQVLQIERLNLNDLVGRAGEIVGPIMGPQVTVTTPLDPALPPVDADRTQIEQLLLNLALNARDAMPEGGTLTITTRVEQLTEPYRQMPAGRYVCLEVTDTGVGMTDEVKTHIFEPFFTTKGARASGLGLSSVYGVVKQSNGFIWCDSAPGAGTSFRIYLRPADRGRAVTIPIAPDANTPVLPAPRPMILVVDDELAIRRWVSRILRARGYDVVDVEDAASALEVLRDPGRRPALAMLDIVMPGVNGTRLAEEIERQWPATRLLFVSGFVGSTSIRAAAIVSRVPILRKPFTPEQVIAAVRDALDEPPPAGAASQVA